jgi:hypothetical protein
MESFHIAASSTAEIRKVPTAQIIFQTERGARRFALVAKPDWSQAATLAFSSLVDRRSELAFSSWASLPLIKQASTGVLTFVAMHAGLPYAAR